MADSIDNFFRGLGMFTEGMDRSNQAEQLDAANDAMLRIQANTKDQDLRNQQMANLQFQLGNNLAAAGMDASSIAATAGALPSQRVLFQAQQNIKQQKNAQNFSALEAQKQRRFEMMKAQAKNKGDATRLADFDMAGNFSVTKEDIKKMTGVAAESRKIFNNVTRIKELFDETGTSDALYMDNSKFRALQGSLRNLQLIAKNEKLFGLGVLTGPDLDLLEEITGSVGGVGGITSTQSGFKAKLNEFTDRIQNNIMSETQSRGFKLAERSDLSDLYLKARVSTENKNKLDAIEQRFGSNPRLVTAVKTAIANPSDPKAQMLLNKLNLNVSDLME